MSSAALHTLTGSALGSFAERLSQSAVSEAAGRLSWLLPVVQSIHILAIAAVMTATAMFNLQLMGVIATDRSVRQSAKRLLPPAWLALLILALTGIVMIVGEPKRELGSAIFWWKMALIAIAVTLTAILGRTLEDKPVRARERPQRLALAGVAVLLVALWVAILSCGRWIAYGQ